MSMKLFNRPFGRRGVASMGLAALVATATFVTATVPEARILDAVTANFDLTPKGITTALDLRKPIYSATSAYGHFGRKPEKHGTGKNARTEFSWERTDRAAALKKAAQSQR